MKKEDIEKRNFRIDFYEVYNKSKIYKKNVKATNLLDAIQQIYTKHKDKDVKVVYCECDGQLLLRRSID